MVRVTASFLALSLVIQAAIVQAFESGFYEILTPDEQHTFGFDHSDSDVPLRLVLTSSPETAILLVEHASPSEYYIRPYDRSEAYGLVPKNQEIVAIGYRKQLFKWAITDAGPLLHRIQIPYQDKLFTVDEQDPSAVVLRPATGSLDQYWRFVKVPGVQVLYHKKGSRNRFCVQE